MTTMRYSGELRIRVTYLEPTHESPPPAGMTNAMPHGEYRCHVVRPTRHKLNNADRTTVYVGARIEHGSGIGVDSPEAFDEAARAAIAFAEHENPGAGFGDTCAYDRDLTDRHVGRSPSQAWPAEKTAAAG